MQAAHLVHDVRWQACRFKGLEGFYRVTLHAHVMLAQVLDGGQEACGGLRAQVVDDRPALAQHAASTPAHRAEATSSPTEATSSTAITGATVCRLRGQQVRVRARTDEYE